MSAPLAPDDHAEWRLSGAWSGCRSTFSAVPTIPIVNYLKLDGGKPGSSRLQNARAAVRSTSTAATPAPGVANGSSAGDGCPTTGVVRSFSIIHRAAPGVPAPFVVAVVDLDGGGKVKANIVDVEPDTRRRCGWGWR